jgi:hypothetical protein
MVIFFIDFFAQRKVSYNFKTAKDVLEKLKIGK